MLDFVDGVAGGMDGIDLGLYPHRLLQRSVWPWISAGQPPQTPCQDFLQARAAFNGGVEGKQAGLFEHFGITSVTRRTPNIAEPIDLRALLVPLVAFLGNNSCVFRVVGDLLTVAAISSTAEATALRFVEAFTGGRHCCHIAVRRAQQPVENVLIAATVPRQVAHHQLRVFEESRRSVLEPKSRTMRSNRSRNYKPGGHFADFVVFEDFHPPGEIAFTLGNVFEHGHRPLMGMMTARTLEKRG